MCAARSADSAATVARHDRLHLGSLRAHRSPHSLPAVRSDARCHGRAPADRRAPVWHHQGPDGLDPLLTRTLKRVSTEMSLHILAYNIKRVIAIIGVGPLLQAIRA